jgi:hypothetical protein
MDKAAKIVLGLFAALFGGMMVYSERTAPSKAPLLGYAVAFFCFAITAACFSKALRILAVRISGAMVFLGTVAYLVDEPGKKYTATSDPHWLNAILALISFGVPGLIAALGGAYPKWAKGAEVFRGEASPAEDSFDGDWTSDAE